jgi:hypothetical protein
MEKPRIEEPKDNLLSVPQTHWSDLEARDLKKVCELSLARLHPPDGLLIRIFNKDILVDIQNRCLKHLHHDQWETITQPLMELITLVYLVRAAPVFPSQEMISVHELKDAHFFQGPHALPLSPVLKHYGNDLEGFKNAAMKIGGEAVDFADVAYRFFPFPKIPIYCLLWEGDEEFEPNISVLFDRSIERHLAADAILGVVNLVVNALLNVE